MKPCVLVLSSAYLPGYLAGGPVRSIANLIHRFGQDFTWKVITRDRDFKSQASYGDVPIDRWCRVGSADVYYASPEALGAGRMLRLIRDTPHDLLYLNSFFDPRFSALPMLARKFGVLQRRPVLIAPRGEFSEGAYALKRWKKAPFVQIMSMFGVHTDADWHASTELEASDIRRVIGASDAQVHVASNLAASEVLDGVEAKCSRGSELRVCFLSRISPKKNLDFALRVLAQVRQPVSFTVYGPKEDGQHWAECEQLVRALPAHIRFDYAGAIPHERVREELAKHDLFFLPTRGENYGHVLVEAWSAGLPVLTGDQTPWRELEAKGVGWDLSLDSEARFVATIDQVACWTEEAHQRSQVQCRSFIREHLQGEDDVSNNRRMFLSCASAPRSDFKKGG